MVGLCFWSLLVIGTQVSFLMLQFIKIMQEQNVFDELKFRQKLQTYVKNESGRIEEDDLAAVLAQFNLDQPKASIRKVSQFFSFFCKQKTNRSIIHEEEEQEEEEQKQGEDQDKQPPVVQDQQPYQLNVEEAVKYAEMLRKKIKFSVWKKTASLLGLQEQVFRLSKKKYFPLKDPGHNAKVKVVVGEELQSYKSRVHIKIQKKSIQKSSTLLHKGQDLWVAVKIITSNLQQSRKFGQLWKGMYQLIKTISQQLPDGPEFVKTFQVITEQQQRHLMIKIKCNNPDIHQLMITVVQFFDKIFKTQIKLILDMFFDFNYDFGRLMAETSSLYEILTNNIRIRLNYKSTPFMTALKQLMIANNAFEGISYVSDDPQTLALIGFVCAHQCDINIRFKNPNISNPQQQTLKQLLSMMMKSRSVLEEIGEGYPEFKSMIENVMKNKIQVEAQIFSLFINADLYLQGLDHLVLDQSPLMQGYQNDDD